MSRQTSPNFDGAVRTRARRRRGRSDRNDRIARRERTR